MEDSSPDTCRCIGNTSSAVHVDVINSDRHPFRVSTYFYSWFDLYAYDNCNYCTPRCEAKKKDDFSNCVLRSLFYSSASDHIYKLNEGSSYITNRCYTRVSEYQKFLYRLLEEDGKSHRIYAD